MANARVAMVGAMRMRGSSMDIKLSLLVAGLSLIAGCFAGEAGVEAIGTEGDDTGGSGTSGPSAPSTTGVDESGNGDGGSTAGPQGEGDTGDAGCDLDCGEGGACDFDDLGEPVCTCFDGYAPYGLRCLPCTPTDGVFDVDVPSVAVTATFTLGGEPFPPSIYERGRILLRDPATGDEIVLGDTHDGSGEVSVMPGTYALHYAWVDGDNVVPANRGAKLATVEIPNTGSHDLVVDVPVVELAGSFTFNGAEPPGSQYENGRVVLVSEASGDEVPLGDTRDGEYRVKVIPGSYSLRYRAKVAEDIAPINRDAHIGDVYVDGSTASQTFDVDVPVTTLSGAFTIDGAAAPPSIYENGRIVLRNASTGDEVELGQTRDGSYSVPVVTGSYQLIYQRLQGGQEVPVNRAALLDEVAIEGQAQGLDVDVVTAVVTGVITVDGGVPPSNPGDDGLLLLRNLDTGDEALLGNTANASYTQRVVRGAYDVYYRQETSSGGVPVNTNAFLQAVDVQGGASLDIDVPMVTVSADVTVGGQAPPSSVYDDGVLYLKNPETGDSVLLGNTRLAALQRPVVPGTYDVLYVVEAAGPTMPINARSRLTTVDVEATTALEIDIPVAVLQGGITVGGEAPPQSAYNRAVLLLHDVATNDVVYLGGTESGGFARTLTAGTYVLVYQVLATTGLLPANTNAGLACLEL